MNRRIRPEVLIVDDRTENLVALEAALEGCACDVKRAHSGEEALYALLERDFACVLLDVLMPGMDGFETAALMRQNAKTAKVPIVFITAHSMDEGDRWKGYKRGAFDVIMKPVDPFVLRSKVNVFLELHEQRVRLELALAERELLLKESHHRIKNNLAIVAAIISLQVPYVNDPRDRRSFEQLKSRIDTIALVHEQLYSSDDFSSIDLQRYFESIASGIVGMLAGPRVTASVDAGALRSTSKLAVSLGLIATECLTNSIKHAFPDGARGTIAIGLRLEGEEARLSIADDGRGMGDGQLEGSEGSLGMLLIKSLVEQIGGVASVGAFGAEGAERPALETRSGTRGTAIDIRFPASAGLSPARDA